MNRFHHNLLCFGLIAFSLSATSSYTQVNVSSSLTIDLPAQSLDTALASFAAQTGIQILYDSELAARRRAPAVKGQLTTQEALSRLLVGSGLIPRMTGERSITLVSNIDDADVIPLETLRVDAQVLIGGRQSYEAYARLVQSAVVDKLESSEATKFGDFRLALRLWIDRGGAVSKVELDSTTGDQSIDAAMPQQLGSIVVQPPPIGMPQPVRIRVNARGIKESTK